ncbi:H/ACA ribonucleoprotein complex non-core subunit NAF1 isoform X2 [Gadus morhua]|uniref:H/ACA ribonucleoprotein complex non-core subunit NAF1 isoform X2 n=1 Tax=Gadus morhua TaxID=8049 RepID=UPI0011B82AA9|nr:H/ACA ribonucleoprotein complex non-core subunit NAF1 isoform X2 [Gadus morhua]
MAGKDSSEVGEQPTQPAEQPPRPAEQLPQTAEQLPQTAEQLPQSAEQLPQLAEQLPQSAEQLQQPAELEEEMDTKAATQSETLHAAHGNTHPPKEVDPQPAAESQAPGEASAKGDLCMDVCMDGDQWTEDRRAAPAGPGDGSEDSDSSSSSSSAASPPCVRMLDEEDDEGFSQQAQIKTRDEVLLEELPAVEELCVSLPESAEIQPIGTVTSVIQQLMIVQSLKGTPPLTEDSIIFTSDRLAVGKVFEVFGPVTTPYYVLRFNSEEEIVTKGLVVGCTVFYTPEHKEYTGYVLTKHLQNLKGSDASWKNDQEPPPESLDYSDDEEEQDAKKKKRQGSKKKKNENAPANPQSKNYLNTAAWCLALLCLLLLAGLKGLAFQCTGRTVNQVMEGEPKQKGKTVLSISDWMDGISHRV